MTRYRTPDGISGRGAVAKLAKGGDGATKIERRLAELRAENATRVPCAYCGVPFLPKDLGRHEIFCEPEDE